jgi:hypothetical protein
LPVLWCPVEAQAVSIQPRRHGNIRQKEVLRPDVHGTGNDFANRYAVCVPMESTKIQEVRL